MHPGVLWHFREGKCSPFSLRGREKRHSAWRGDIPLANPIVSDGIQRCIVGGYKSVLEKLYLPTIVSDLAEGSAYAGLCVERKPRAGQRVFVEITVGYAGYMQENCGGKQRLF